ncbi:hypothetical protein BJ170DRAFT_326130 [Xylariales sp. AK1849]|nr:hypothetical protein BJ170DRAFT_326130 [Xylariales sp. AK1849]
MLQRDLPTSLNPHHTFDTFNHFIPSINPHNRRSCRPSRMDLSLPKLTPIPTRLADCCLSISTKLIDVLTDAILANRSHSGATTILSIGSGTGLLEAILLSFFRESATKSSVTVSVEGVEVHQPGNNAVNLYLPEPAINTVRGTWDMSVRVEDDDVHTVLFVYPRLPALVSGYVERILRDAPQCDSIIWLGPCADWVDFGPCFQGNERSGPRIQIVQQREGGKAGLVDYEMMVVMVVQRDPAEGRTTPTNQWHARQRLFKEQEGVPPLGTEMSVTTARTPIT